MGMSNGYGGGYPQMGRSGSQDAFNNAFGFRPGGSGPYQPPRQDAPAPPELPPWTTPGPGTTYPGKQGFMTNGDQMTGDRGMPQGGFSNAQPSPLGSPVTGPTIGVGDPFAAGAQPPVGGQMGKSQPVMGGNMGLPEWMQQRPGGFGGLLGRRM